MSTFIYIKNIIPNFYKPLFKTAETEIRTKILNFFFFIISLSKQSIKHNHIKPKKKKHKNHVRYEFKYFNLLTGHYATINCVRERNYSYIGENVRNLFADEQNERRKKKKK